MSAILRLRLLQEQLDRIMRRLETEEETDSLLMEVVEASKDVLGAVLDVLLEQQARISELSTPAGT